MTTIVTAMEPKLYIGIDIHNLFRIKRKEIVKDSFLYGLI
jgi:hypothetical protein